MDWGFTREEVDELVAERKIVRGDAKWEVEQESGGESMHFPEVWRANPEEVILGLEFRGRRRNYQAPTWSFVLLYRGERVRGVDWELKYRTAAGANASGWHEHGWDSQYGAERRYPRADLEELDCYDMLLHVLRMWNIEVRGQLNRDMFFV